MKTFYFVAVTNALERSLAVIDLAECVAYEREDWHTVDDQDFYNLDQAIEHARKLAKYNNVPYKPFESRYGSEYNENQEGIKQYPEGYEL